MDAAGFFPLLVAPLPLTGSMSCKRVLAVIPLRQSLQHNSPHRPPPAAVIAEALASLIFDRLTRPRPDFAGIALDRPVIMGIINTTPDSFSDGGDHADASVAITAGHAMVAAGADILDIGGESTRPGADLVIREEECARILPAITRLPVQDTVFPPIPAIPQLWIRRLRPGQR